MVNNIETMRIIDLKPRRIFFIVCFIFLVSYSIFQARFLILGPQIWLINPQNGQTVRNPLITIEGRAKNVAWISLNDRQIFTDEHGVWSEKLILSQGLSIMTVKARDRFGREREKNIQIVLNWL